MTNLLRAASFVLCGDNIEEQLNSLDNAIMNDLCNVANTKRCSSLGKV